jgi:7-carboxy-7-deazaguanine synthase
LIEPVVKSARLRVNEIFHSLQGEADAVGYPTVFVRLTGCPLRCQLLRYRICLSFRRVVRPRNHRTKGPRVWGAACVRHRGRALGTAKLPDIARARYAITAFKVSLETSGALDIAAVDSRVSRVIDVKTPGSREAQRNRLENFALLTPRDQLKFVICSREDYDWSKAFLQEHGLPDAAGYLFSPSYNEVVAHGIGRLDPGGSSAGSFPIAASQGSVGRHTPGK